MDSSYPIIKIVLSLAMDLFLLRLWMEYLRVDYYNPFTQSIIKISNPLISPLRKVLPVTHKIDLSSLLVVYAIALLKVAILFYFQWHQWVFAPSLFYYALLTVIYSLGNLMFWLLFIRAIMSWFASYRSPTAQILAELTEPLIQPIRRFIPPIGMIDISFMIFVFLLYFLNQLAFKVLGMAWIIAVS